MYVFVSDLYLQDYVGGAELTTEAILQNCNIPAILLRSEQINESIVDSLKDRHWIFGNFSNMSDEMVLYCCKNLKYSIIEYDYKYCIHRLPEKHMTIEGHCDCENSPHGKLISVFYANADNLWFMSEKQKDFYCEKFPFLDKPSSHVLSSVFSKDTLSRISSMCTDEKDDVWLIQDSPSWVKGTPDAVGYAEENNLKYELFSGISYPQMLEKFAKSKGFVFLPRSMDTCPRTVIEAKLLGCELKINENVQHKDESWFSGTKKDTFDYLESRVSFFWETLMDGLSPKVPTRITNTQEETHFKVIIPVYNSEQWIGRTIEGVLGQEYSNYECVVADDMSTDSTYEVASSFKSPKLSIERNSEKKFALKNIYDSIKNTDPKQDDVVVVLDGDDWFTNNHVLSKLDEYYSTDKCLVTYGSFVQYPHGHVGTEASKYPDSVVDENSYRKEEWRASHLKTFKYSLWERVKEEDLKDSRGNFYEIAYDQAMMLPLLEMAGSNAKHVPEILYVYNAANPNAVNKTRVEKQYKTMLDIRSKKPYERILSEDIS